MPTPKNLAYVGCRTTRERNARGDGISVFRTGAPGAPWALLQALPVQPNPSFLAFDRTGRFLLTVHGDSSEVSSFRIDDAGLLVPVGTWTTQGRNPVHLVMDHANRFLIVANHITSSLAVLPFDAETGHLGDVAHLVPIEAAPGPHRVEQAFAKPHQVELDPGGRFVLVPDKGADRIFSYALDPATGALTLARPAPASSREGAGPRHIAFHPAAPFAFVLNELDSTLLACRYDKASGGLVPFQVISALPDSFMGNSRAAEIAVSADGRFVYASNRGHDSIGAFAIDAPTGRLSPAGWVPSGGKTPRFFALDPTGTALYAANEESDTIVALAIDPRAGGLSPLHEVARTGSPTCILFKSIP